MMSEYDRTHVGDILDGKGNNFTAMLLRLICKADMLNREKLRIAYPDEDRAYENWYNGEHELDL